MAFPWLINGVTNYLGSGRVEGRMVLATFLVIARSRMEVLISENVVIYNTFVHALTIKVFNGFILAS